MTLDFSLAKDTTVGRQLAASGNQYEPEVAQLLARLIRRSRDFRTAFIDVGANVGYFPLMASHLAMKEDIALDCYAHEPLPELYAIAESLKKANALDYTLSGLAVSDFVGSAEFYVSAKSDSSNSLVKGFRKAKDVIGVGVSTLDALYTRTLQEGGYSEVIIMIDVETAEPAVLRGARELVAAHRPLIICEVLAGRTEHELEGIFREFAYSPFRYDGTRWIREAAIAGDTTYQHRDWFFVPAEREAEFRELFDSR